MDILPKFASETARKQDASVLAALALHDIQLTMIQIHMVKFQQRYQTRHGHFAYPL
jgi:hypothetical protein